jgi:uncharacterized protein YjiK
MLADFFPIRNMNKHILFKILLLIFLFDSTGCKLKPRRSFLPAVPDYDQFKKKVLVLDKKLIEISGMFYEDKGKIAAVNDEDGKIFFINENDGSFSTMNFGSKGDYEDITKVGRFYYVLESNGNLHRIYEGNAADYAEYKFPLKKIEFESLYYDKQVNKLILVSKDHGRGKPGVFAFSFDLQTQSFPDTPYFFISMKQINMAVKNNTAECKPSAAAIQPVTNKLFIIASVGKLLLECDPNGKLHKAYKINPAQFPQPEGITFAPNGDMYISNEGLNGKATILKFPFKPSTVKVHRRR